MATYVPAPSLRPTATSPSRVEATAETTGFTILDDLMFENLQGKYRAAGVPLDRDSYDELSDGVCKDMQKRGEGYLTIGDVSAVPEATQQLLARSAWLIFAFSCYPENYVHSDADLDAIADSMVEDLPEYQRRMEAAGLWSPGSESSTHYNGLDSGYMGSRSSDYSGGYAGSSSSGSGYSGGYSGSGSSGSGYSTVCNDGWVSQSGGKRGACSHHGGVSK